MSAAPTTPIRPDPSASRAPVLWTVLLLVGIMVAISTFVARETGTTGVAEVPDEPIAPFGAAAPAQCRLLSENSTDYLSDMAMARRIRMRFAACSEAMAAAPDDVHIKVKYALALPFERHDEKLALLRKAAAQDDGEASFAIYEWYRAWDHHLDRPQLVTRLEAAQALRKAAELDYPPAVYDLSLVYDRGGVVKRDGVAERRWLERALQLPVPENVTRADMLIRLGAMQAKSGQDDERARGLALLERLNTAGPFGAKPALAAALRHSDPVRARALYEDAVRDHLGGVAGLAEMLLNGEGGPAEPNRALAILTANRDVARGLLGELYLEGRLVKRDVPKAIDLLISAGVRDYDARLQALQLLAEHPEVSIAAADIVTYEATQAAELDEPGAIAALIALKLSPHPQFRDPAGACKLLATAAQRGDQDAPQRLKDCPAP